jgi:hypothetical protein
MREAGCRDRERCFGVGPITIPESWRASCLKTAHVHKETAHPSFHYLHLSSFVQRSVSRNSCQSSRKHHRTTLPARPYDGQSTIQQLLPHFQCDELQQNNRLCPRLHTAYNMGSAKAESLPIICPIDTLARLKSAKQRSQRAPRGTNRVITR